MKYWVLIASALLFSNTLLANNSFSDYFEYESSLIPVHADEITQHFTTDNQLNPQKKIKRFKEINNALNNQIKATPKQAVLWFSKGLNFKNRLIALEQIQTQGLKVSLPIIHQTVDYMKKVFNKAMQLD